MTGQGPESIELFMVIISQPVTDAVTGDGAGHGPADGRPEFEMAGGDQGAKGKHQYGTGNQQTDQGQRLGTGNKENDKTGPDRILADPVEEAL